MNEPDSGVLAPKWLSPGCAKGVHPFLKTLSIRSADYRWFHKYVSFVAEAVLPTLLAPETTYEAASSPVVARNWFIARIVVVDAGIGKKQDGKQRGENMILGTHSSCLTKFTAAR